MQKDEGLLQTYANHSIAVEVILLEKMGDIFKGLFIKIRNNLFGINCKAFSVVVSAHRYTTPNSSAHSDHLGDRSVFGVTTN